MERRVRRQRNIGAARRQHAGQGDETAMAAAEMITIHLRLEHRRWDQMGGLGGEIRTCAWNWQLVCAFRQRAPPTTLCGLMRDCGGGQMDAESQAALLGCLHTPAAALLPADADYTRWAGRAMARGSSPSPLRPSQPSSPVLHAQSLNLY